MDGFLAHEFLFIVPFKLPSPETFETVLAAFHVEPTVLDDCPGGVDPVSYFDLGDNFDNLASKGLQELRDHAMFGLEGLRLSIKG